MEAPAYLRIQALQRFENARRRARLASIWNGLLGKPQTLLSFEPISVRLPQRTGLQRGVQEIPVEQIVGSLGKAHMFDRSFGPLRDEQRDRWVDIVLLHQASGWEPIVVHEIGGLYFVEDGHHRVSVARDAGLKLIEAYVTEHPSPKRFDVNDTLGASLRRLAEPDAARATVSPS